VQLWRRCRGAETRWSWMCGRAKVDGSKNAELLSGGGPMKKGWPATGGSQQYMLALATSVFPGLAVARIWLGQSLSHQR